MTRRSNSSLLVVALTVLVTAPDPWAATTLGLAHGQDAPPATPLGWTEQAPTIASGQVIAVSIGAAHDDDGPLAAARLASRRRGQARATDAIQRWADDALAAIAASPRDAQAVHDAITASASVSRVRGRADGSAVVEVGCPLSALREALDHASLPWHR